MIDESAAVIVAIRGFGRIDPRAFAASLGHTNLIHHLHLHRSDLDDVIDIQDPFLTGIEPGAIDESSIRAVQIFHRQDAVFTANERVLARRPDAVGRLLLFRVDLGPILFHGYRQKHSPDEKQALLMLL